MQNKRELVRIQKVLSESGIMSRRKAEDYIEKGKVTVNGRKASIGQKIDPARDIIAVEGVRVDTRQHQKKIYLALHKPRGYVTTMDDELDRRCVHSWCRMRLPGLSCRAAGPKFGRPFADDQ